MTNVITLRDEVKRSLPLKLIYRVLGIIRDKLLGLGSAAWLVYFKVMTSFKRSIGSGYYASHIDNLFYMDKNEYYRQGSTYLSLFVILQVVYTAISSYYLFFMRDITYSTVIQFIQWNTPTIFFFSTILGIYCFNERQLFVTEYWGTVMNLEFLAVAGYIYYFFMVNIFTDIVSTNLTPLITVGFFGTFFMHHVIKALLAVFALLRCGFKFNPTLVFSFNCIKLIYTDIYNFVIINSNILMDLIAKFLTLRQMTSIKALHFLHGAKFLIYNVIEIFFDYIKLESCKAKNADDLIPSPIRLRSKVAVCTIIRLCINFIIPIAIILHIIGYYTILVPEQACRLFMNDGYVISTLGCLAALMTIETLVGILGRRLAHLDNIEQLGLQNFYSVIFETIPLAVLPYLADILNLPVLKSLWPQVLVPLVMKIFCLVYAIQRTCIITNVSFTRYLQFTVSLLMKERIPVVLSIIRTVSTLSYYYYPVSRALGLCSIYGPIIDSLLLASISIYTLARHTLKLFFNDSYSRRYTHLRAISHSSNKANEPTS